MQMLSTLLGLLFFLGAHPEDAARMRMVQAASSSSSPYVPMALQSGPDLAGSTFPASATYDPVTNSVVITGSTFGRFFEKTGSAVTSIPRRTSSCFLASVELPSDIGTQLRWKDLQTIGSTEDVANEACAASLFHERRGKLIVTGQSERGGFAEDLYDDSQYTDATQYGLLLEFNNNNNGSSSSAGGEAFQLTGGRALQFSRVSYPVAIASADADEYVYVASQETNSVQRNDIASTTTHTGETVEAVEIASQEQMDPMRYFVYGMNYRLSIGRYKMFDRQYNGGPLQETFSQDWKKMIATENNAAVHLAGLVEISSSSTLVVVGTTDGTGAAFGGSNTIGTEPNMDGFISKFAMDTGNLLGENGASSRRIQSVDGQDDWIAGLCANDDVDPNHIYIVGATAGDLKYATSSLDESVEAYLMKIELSTLETVWTTMLPAVPQSQKLTQVRGISCAVSADGDFVWFGGVVQDGAVLPNSGTMESYGGDDVFVAKVEAEEGVLQFTRQIGSEEDDGLAMRGGLIVDKLGNAVIVGSTYGSFYRTRTEAELEDQDWISDVFVATIAGHDGEIAMPVEHSEFKDTTTANSKGTNDPENNTVQAPYSGSRESGGDGGGLGKGVVIFLSVLMVGVIAAILFVKTRSHINRDVTTDRSQIIHFLNEFDVEDVDLKYSATGGWHCSYSNDLANGRNRRAEREASVSGLLGSSSIATAGLSSTSDPLLTAPLTNGGVLDDAPYSRQSDDDGDNVSSEWGDHRSLFSESSRRHREGYDGLTDAYNASFHARQWDADDNNEHSTWGKEIL